MRLFHKFTDTIFLKEDSSLESQIEELKKVKNQMENKKAINRDIRLFELGLYGENQIIYELKHANVGMYVLHDVTFEYEDLKAQIDFMIFTRGYIYLVECKNLIGNITVDSKGEFQREYEVDGERIKEAIYSPYAQSMRHKDLLKKIWIQNHNSFTTFLLNKQFDTKWFKSLVVIANPKSLLDIKYAPKEIKDHVVRLDGLISYIKRDLEQYDRSLLASEKDTKAFAESYLKRSIPNTTNIADKYKKYLDHSKEIEEKLRTFRKEKSQKMKVPAYYIFTDDELNKLLNVKPKKVEDLNGILPDIKIKYHGEEILKIFSELK